VINLIARFYDASAGEVLIDGVRVDRVRQRELRRQLAVVLQEVFIFTGSVLDNIRLGGDIPAARCVAAAEAVGADPFIRALPGGYQHRMRERGATLSVGQKQLISFARALAHDPRVLVLDEATASIDPETEERLQQAVKTLVRDRTAIVIAHRLATIRDADRVLVLHKGELREQGTLDELLEQGGLFHTLYRLQYPDAAGAVRGAGESGEEGAA
jgi:ATP-binding cassette subfamily B protein